MVTKDKIFGMASVARGINQLESANAMNPKTMARIVLAFMVFILLTASMVSILFTAFAGVGGEFPVASFTYSPEAPIGDDTVTFNASESYDPDGYIVSFKWDFGDGTIVTEIAPVTTHTYDKAGFYTVRLTVTDNDGLTDTGTEQVLVALAITLDPFGMPVANFTYEPRHPCVNETIVFNASASYDHDGYIVSYYWEFGDEANATDMIVDHSYPEAGRYLVRLTVTDNDGRFFILLRFLNVTSDIRC